MTNKIVPSGWQEVKLGDCVSVLGDGLHGTPIYDESGDCYFINGNNLSSGKIVIKNDTKKINNNEAAKYRKQLNNRTIFVSINGTLGNIAFYNDENIILGKSACYFNIIENINKRFVYFTLLDDKFQNYLQNDATGSTIKNVSLKQMRSFPILLPPLPEQERIAGVLGAFDDKIELLREQNKTLEDMAKAIFKSWFVDFDIVKAKQNKENKQEIISKYKITEEIYNLFPDTFTDSPLGPTPTGWKVKKIDDLGSIVCGKTPLTTVAENYGKDIPFITIPDMHNKIFVLETNKNLSYIGADTQKSKYLPPLSISVSCIATPGLVTLNVSESQTNQQINSIIPNNLDKAFYYFFVVKQFSHSVITQGSGGSVFNNLNTSAFKKIDILLNDKLGKEFHSYIENYMIKIIKNSKQIQTLTKLRDGLLPKLISGTIRV